MSKALPTIAKNTIRGTVQPPILPFLYPSRAISTHERNREEPPFPWKNYPNTHTTIPGAVFELRRGGVRAPEASKEWSHLFTPTVVKRPPRSRKAYKERARENPELTTITPSEREAFNRIFSSILAQTTDKSTPVGPYASPELSFGPISSESVDRSVILETAPEVQHFPPALRAMAAKMVFAKRMAAMQPSETSAERAVREKIEAINAQMLECRTDRELYNVLDEKVFSLIDQRKEAHEEPALVSIGSGYSQLLAIGLRMLRKKFDDYDGVMWIFEKVKKLGAESYVIGGSAEVYAEVMISKWLGYRDVGGVVDLCHEMVSSGIEATELTIQVMEKIVGEFELIESGAAGAADKLALSSDDKIAGNQLQFLLASWKDKYKRTEEGLPSYSSLKSSFGRH